MNILIIEDDIYLASNIKKLFKKRVITNLITLISSYEGFIKELPTIKTYDIIIVDIKLKDLDHQNWLDIVKILRSKNIIVPIIIMSGFNDINLIDEAFEIWANDYITKPFRLQELDLRIMRWFKAYCVNLILSNPQIISYKKIQYKFDTNDFYYKEVKIPLTKKSKFILLQLLLQSEKLITESTLREKIWWDIETIKSRNLRVNILRLKKSLSMFGIDNRIQNKRGEGYILKKI